MKLRNLIIKPVKFLRKVIYSLVAAHYQIKYQKQAEKALKEASENQLFDDTENPIKWFKRGQE